MWKEVESRSGYIVGMFLINLWTRRKLDRRLHLHNTQHSNIETCVPIRGIRTYHPSKQAAADPRVRQRSHRDRRICSILFTLAQQPLLGQVLLIVEDSRSHSVRHTTLDRPPLDEWSARRRDLFLTTHNTHKRKKSMTAAGFEPTIPARERPHTNALDRAATERVGRVILRAQNS
jgi:hypothetical protein